MIDHCIHRQSEKHADPSSSSLVERVSDEIVVEVVG